MPYDLDMDSLIEPSSLADPASSSLQPDTISISNVNLSLGAGAARVHILKDISLSVASGEAIGLIGPSGSGKSTLLMVMAGLARPDSGEVVVNGTPFNALDEDALARFGGRQVGIVFQSFHLIPTMTALENVAVPLELAGNADATRRATQKLGRSLARALGPGDLLVLEGGLGAGKTFLVQAIVHALGVPASQPVTSPTFEILHEFQGSVPIVHADLYRLDASEPLDELGLLPRIGNDALVLIEWGERFASQLGDTGLCATLQLHAGSERRCSLRARGPSG